MRHTTTVLIGAGLLTLSACSGSADPSPPQPSPSTSTAAPNTPSPSPSLTPPVMPDAAKAHTKAGAKAFVEYFWEVVNYAQATGDTAAIAHLAADGCKGCQAGIASIDDVYSNGGRITGGEARLSHIVVTFGWVRHTAVADVTFDVDLAPQVVTDGSGRHPGKARHSRDRFNLLAERAQSWQVTDFRAVE